MVPISWQVWSHYHHSNIACVVHTRTWLRWKRKGWCELISFNYTRKKHESVPHLLASLGRKMPIIRDSFLYMLQDKFIIKASMSSYQLEIETGRYSCNLWKNESGNCAIGAWNWKSIMSAIVLLLWNKRKIELPCQRRLWPTYNVMEYRDQRCLGLFIERIYWRITIQPQQLINKEQSWLSSTPSLLMLQVNRGLKNWGLHKDTLKGTKIDQAMAMCHAHNPRPSILVIKK